MAPNSEGGGSFPPRLKVSAREPHPYYPHFQTVTLDFGYAPDSCVVGVLAKFWYQPSRKISKRKFHLVLPEVHKASIQLFIPDFER